MCGLCGLLSGGARGAATGSALFVEHDNRIVRDRERTDRLRTVNQVLAYYRLELRKAGGAHFILRSPTGRTELVNGVADVWHAAAKLRKEPCDPLDPGLVAFLRGSGTAPRAQ